MKVNRGQMLNAPTFLRRPDRGFSHGQMAMEQGKKLSPADLALAKSVGLTLHKYYRDYPWGVLAQHAQGIVQIMLPCFTRYCSMLYISSLDTPASFNHKVMVAGGEFLECYKIPRSGFSATDFFNAWKKAPLRGQGPKPGESAKSPVILTHNQINEIARQHRATPETITNILDRHHEIGGT